MNTSDYRAHGAFDQRLSTSRRSTPVRDSTDPVVIRTVLEDGRTGGFTSVASAAKYFAVTERTVRRWIDKQEVGIGSNGNCCEKIWMVGGQVVSREQRKLVARFKDGRPEQSWKTMSAAAKDLGLAYDKLGRWRQQGPSKSSELSYVGWEMR